MTLRHKTNFVDLSNRGRVIWGTYVSGLHVARLVVKLADGTFLVGDPGTGTPNVSHVENEVVLSSLRWLKLDVPQTASPFREQPRRRVKYRHGARRIDSGSVRDSGKKDDLKTLDQARARLRLAELGWDNSVSTTTWFSGIAGYYDELAASLGR